MKRTTRALVRSAFALAVLAVTALTAASAQADSGEVDYSCEFAFIDPTGELQEGQGTATASFDTIVPDSLVVHVGQTISLGTFTGTITFSDELLDQLRDAGVTTFLTGFQDVRVKGTNLSFGGYFNTSGPFPAQGTRPLDLKGRFEDGLTNPASFILDEPGTYTVRSRGFRLDVEGDNWGPPAGATTSCEPVDGVVVLDTIEVVTDAPPSADPSDSPVRPVLVQTDFAEPEATAAPLIGVGALTMLAATAVGLARGRRRATSRRH
jgi:hypothetical protein